MSFMDKIKGFFGAIKVKVAPVFIAIFGSEGAQQIGKALVVGLNSAMGQLVLKTVEAMLTLKVNGVDATGDQKRAAAFAAIAQEAKAQGIGVSSSLINLMIEMAVQRLQNVKVIQ
jgi:hypothetical protein